MTFVALCIVGVIVALFGLANPLPREPEIEEPEFSYDGAIGPPSWRVILLMILGLVGVMLSLAWYWPE